MRGVGLERQKSGRDARRRIRPRRRHEFFAIGQAEQLKQPRLACQKLQTRALVEPHEPRSGGNTPGVGKQMAVNEASGDARGKRAAIILFDLRAGALHKLSVFHTRGASALASAAIETSIDMLDKKVAERQPALIDENHLTDAATRGIGLLTPKTIGGAFVQT